MTSKPYELREGSLHIAPGRRIVPVQEHQRYLQANEVLEAAQQKAQALVQAAQQKAQALVQSAQQQAQNITNQADAIAEAGRQKGYNHGLVQASEEKAQYCVQVCGDFSRVIEALQEQLADTVVHIIRKIWGDLGEDLSVKRSVEQALTTLIGEHKTLLVKVNPSKLTMIEAHMKSIHSKNKALFQHLQVIGDDLIAADQAIIETSSSVMVFDMQQQLELLQEYATNALGTHEDLSV